MRRRRKTTKRSRSGGEESSKGGTLKTKLEETQKEIYTSSDEADAHHREAEAGGGALATLTPDVLDLKENVKMDFQ